MWIALKRVIWHGEVDHGANQVVTAFDIEKGHILSRLRLDHASIGSVKRSPPLHALLKWNGCGHDIATLALLRIEGKWVGEGARGTTDRVRLSKITCVHGSREMSIQREVPGAAVVLLHTHKRHNTWSQLIKENMLTILSYTHHVPIISAAATRISGRCALNPVSQSQIRKFIQVAIGVKAEIERRGRLRTFGGASRYPPPPPARPPHHP